LPFEFATASRIRFGDGVVAELGAEAARRGRRALLVTGGDAERATVAREALGQSGVEALVFSVAGEPDVATAEQGTSLARQNACDLVIGFGGGSALDAGKAIAALAANPGEPLDYLEVIGRGKALQNPSLPYIAVPTTAGTGAEVTRNAVLRSEAHRVKVSLRSPLMLPELALVDPELTHPLPPAITASTGLDALAQVLEPFVSSRPNPITDALCREGMRLAARSLGRAYRDGRDAEARRDMSLVSLLGGLALANAKLGAVHGLAGPLGGMFPAPHGAVCGLLLPHVVQANVEALGTRAPESEVLERYHEVARILTGQAQARARDAVTWLRELGARLALPPLSVYGVTPSDLPDVASKAARSSSMKGNAIELEQAELGAILTAAL